MKGSEFSLPASSRYPKNCVCVHKSPFHWFGTTIATSRRNQKSKFRKKRSLDTNDPLVARSAFAQGALAANGSDTTKVNSNQNSNTNTITTATKPVRVNGFDVNNIFSTLEALQADPSLSKFEFRVRNKWIQGGHNRSV